MRSKDTEFAAIKLRRCPVEGGAKVVHSVWTYCAKHSGFNFRSGAGSLRTVRVGKLLFRKCRQAHDNNLEVLQHIILYLSMRRPQSTGNPGHAGAEFFEIPYFQEFCLSRPRHFSKNRPKIIKKICGVHPLLTGLRPSHPPRWVLKVWLQWCLLTMTVCIAIVLL